MICIHMKKSFKRSLSVAMGHYHMIGYWAMASCSNNSLQIFYW